VNGAEVWRYRIRLFRQLPWSISPHFRSGTNCQGRTTAATGAPCGALIRQDDGTKVRPYGVLTGEAAGGAAVRETEVPAVIIDDASSLQPLGNPKNFEIQQRGDLLQMAER
jgi:hypothetical protein